jgi:hypothetical protein
MTQSSKKTDRPERPLPQEKSVAGSEPSLVVKAMMELYPQLTRQEVEALLDAM